MAFPIKDSTQQHPVADAWKPAFRGIIDALRVGDYGLTEGVASVEAIGPDLAKQIEDQINDYAETLDALPDVAWDSSVAQWVDGYWDVLVDLWTVESGESDLAISATIVEDGIGYRIKVVGVYVP